MSGGLTPTKEQQDIIGHAGCLVAIARPGSGKTYVVTEKIRNVIEHLPSHRGVIAISYTNKASNELHRRVGKAQSTAGKSFFGTIDRFCDREIIFPFLPHLWGRPA